MGPLVIAQVSADRMLAHSREELLRTAGYEVSTFTSFNDFLENCNQNLDLLIIGHSLENHSLGDVESLFKRKNPRPIIVQLVSPGQERSGADVVFDVYEGPDKLLKFVRQITANRGFRKTGA